MPDAQSVAVMHVSACIIADGALVAGINPFPEFMVDRDPALVDEPFIRFAYAKLPKVGQRPLTK
eukprot:11430086-Prorocentrum_lima.AAC.1